MSLPLPTTALDEVVILYLTIDRFISSYKITWTGNFDMRKLKLKGDRQTTKRAQRIKNDHQSGKRETQAKVRLRSIEREQKERDLSSQRNPRSVPSKDQPRNDNPKRTDFPSQEPSRLNCSNVPGTEKTRPPEPLRNHPLRKLGSHYSSPPSSPAARGRRKSLVIVAVPPASPIHRSMLNSQRGGKNNSLLTDRCPAVSLPGSLNPYSYQDLPADDLSSRPSIEDSSHRRTVLPIQKISGGQRAVEPTFLSLPPEVRNKVYEFLSQEEWHFTGEHPHSMSISAISLARASRQVNTEMNVVPYALADVHVYDWGTFFLWLSNRSSKQRLAITILFVHVTIFLENVRDHEDFKGGKPTHTVRTLTLTVWPSLDRLKKVLVLIHPYRPTFQPALRDPRLESDQIIWTIRAHNIAVSYSDQIRLLHREADVEFVGRWSEPRSSHNLDSMEQCWNSGFFIRQTNGYWGCISPGCKYLWESRVNTYEH